MKAQSAEAALLLSDYNKVAEGARREVSLRMVLAVAFRFMVPWRNVGELFG
jgi:hypothetical protein